MKELHDRHIIQKRFHEGQNVLLYFGAIEIENLELGQRLTVNGHRLKPYQGIIEENKGIGDLDDSPSQASELKSVLSGNLTLKDHFFLIYCKKHMESAVQKNCQVCLTSSSIVIEDNIEFKLGGEVYLEN